MTKSIFKKTPFVILGLFLIAGVLTVGYFALRNNPVYFRIVSEDTFQYSDETKVWITTKRQTPGIFLYVPQDSDPFELLLVDNRREKQNLYDTTDITAKLSGKDLEISISDKPAASEEEVRYNLEVYFILKDQPEKIIVKVDGEKQAVVREAGGFQITQ